MMETPHFVLLKIVGQVVFVSVAAVVADSASPTMGSVVVTVFIGLWLVFLVNHGSDLTSLWPTPRGGP